MDLKNKDQWLFKYMPFNLNAVKLFVNNHLWFGKPDIQNDPNECEFTLDYKNDPPEQFITKFILTDDFRVVIKETDSGKKLNDGSEKHRFENYLKKNIRNHVGICSFSEKMDDILMWSHYSDSNNGICIVFNKDKLRFSLSSSIAEKVQYSKILPCGVFNSFNDFGILYTNKNIFSHKYINWEYEDEYRFIQPYYHRSDDNDLHRLIEFTPECIEGVIIGEKFTTIDFETLTNILLCREEYRKVTFWQSEKNIYHNNMRIYPILDTYSNPKSLILKNSIIKYSK